MKRMIKPLFLCPITFENQAAPGDASVTQELQV